MPMQRQLARQADVRLACSPDTDVHMLVSEPER